VEPVRVIRLLGATVTTASVLRPPPGIPAPPAVEVLANDRRATRYGKNAAGFRARLDDGGFTLHYGFGRGMTTLTPAHRLAVDAAWRALERGAWPGRP
jgi:hypothetical protein